MKHATDCMLLALVLLTVSACGKQPDGQEPNPSTNASQAQKPGPSPSPSPAPAPEPGPVPSPAPLPSPAPAPDPGRGGPAAWSDRPNTSSWTSAVSGVVKANLASFERAKDRETFCPGYASASLAQRETCWVRLVSAVAEFESEFNPGTMFRESDGTWSVGLLQLSSGECANAPSNSALKDPVQNLICGTRMMAKLIARYGYVTSPDNRHGAAAYWSTLRAPYTSGGAHLGKKTQVARIAGQYKSVNPVSVDFSDEEIAAVAASAEE